MSKIKIGVLGSCASRDIFNSEINPNYKDYFSFEIGYTNESLLTLMTKAVPYNDEDVQVFSGNDKQRDVKNRFMKRCLYKNFFDRLKNVEIDYLIIDTILDAKWGIVSFDDYMFFNYDAFEETKFYQNISNKRLITLDKDTEEYVQLYKDGCDRFFKMMEDEFPDIRVIVNPARNIYRIRNSDGSIEVNEFLKNQPDNDYLSLLDGYIIENYDVEVLEFDDDILLNPNHKWGLGSNHYMPEYYTDMTEQLLKIDKRNKLLSGNDAQSLNDEIRQKRREEALVNINYVKESLPRTKVGVLGSCSSRDLFNSQISPNYKEHCEITFSHTNESIISIMNDPVPYDRNLLNLDATDEKTMTMIGFMERCLKKTFFEKLDVSEMDYLIIDVALDVRWGLIEFDGYIFLNYIKFKDTDFYKNLKNKRHITVTENTKEYMELFKKSCEKFFKIMEDKYPDIKIIINPTKNSHKILNEDGSIEVNENFKKMPDNDYLSMMYEYLIENYDVEVLEYDNNTLVDPNHKWGLGPKHYVTSYYKDRIKQIRDIALRNNLLSDNSRSYLNNQIKEYRQKEYLSQRKKEYASGINVGFLGSSATRDLFKGITNPEYEDYFRLNFHYDTESLISIMEEKVPYNIKDIEIEPLDDEMNKMKTRFMRRCLDKTFFEELSKTNINYLIMDVALDVRWGIIEFNNYRFFNYRPFHKTEFFKKLENPEIVTINNNTDKFLELYKKNCYEFFTRMQKEHPEIRIIINPVRDCFKVLKDDGEVEIIKDFQYRYDNIYLPVLEEFIIKNFDVDILDFDKETLLDSNHARGLGAKHYVYSYYTKQTSQILDIARRDEALFEHEEINYKIRKDKREKYLEKIVRERKLNDYFNTIQKLNSEKNALLNEMNK